MDARRNRVIARAKTSGAGIFRSLRVVSPVNGSVHVKQLVAALACGAAVLLLGVSPNGAGLIGEAQAKTRTKVARTPIDEPPRLPDGPLTLTPGRGADGMVIGESTPDAVEQLIGPGCARIADKSISCMFAGNGAGRERDSRTNRPDGFEFVDGVLSKIVVGKGKTEVFVNGIGVGASQDEVRAALQTPPLVHADSAENWAWPELGLSLSFIRGTLVGFELSRPATLELGKFSMKVKPKAGVDGLRLGQATQLQVERFYGVRYRPKPGPDGFVALVPDESAEGYWRARFAPTGLKLRRGKVVAMEFDYGVSWASLERGVQFNQEGDEVEKLLGHPRKKKAIPGKDDESTWTYPRLGLTLTFTLLGLTRITIA